MSDKYGDRLERIAAGDVDAIRSWTEDDYVFHSELTRGALRSLLSALAAAEKGKAEAEANYRFMVECAADEKLDGYRELGARAAAAENERDATRTRVAALEEGLMDACDAIDALTHLDQESTAGENARVSATRLNGKLRAILRGDKPACG